MKNFLGFVIWKLIELVSECSNSKWKWKKESREFEFFEFLKFLFLEKLSVSCLFLWVFLCVFVFEEKLWVSGFARD